MVSFVDAAPFICVGRLLFSRSVFCGSRLSRFDETHARVTVKLEKQIGPSRHAGHIR